MDVYDGTYHKITTTGDVPATLLGVAFTCIGTAVYQWGGWDKSLQPSNDAFRTIEVGEWVWRRVKLTSQEGAPPAKAGSRMAAHGNNLVLVGGTTGCKVTDLTNEVHMFSRGGGE